MKRKYLSIAAAGIWVTLSEFIRNEFLLKGFWIRHFDSLGLKFETTPLNGVFWLVWSFICAYMIFRLLQKFSFVETLVLVWLPAFLMMWITVYNLQTLPLKLLIFAIPLSVLEIFIAGLIITRLREKASPTA